MKIAFDLDGTVLTQGSPEANYRDSDVIPEMLLLVNQLYDEGNEIYFFTARHFKHFIYTNNFLLDAGFHFHGLIMNKPSVDLFVDDRGFRMENKNTKELLELIEKMKVTDVY